MTSHVLALNAADVSEGVRSALSIQDGGSLLWNIMVISAAKPPITHASTSKTSGKAAQFSAFS